jgi:hypothetical protein
MESGPHLSSLHAMWLPAPRAVASWLRTTPQELGRSPRERETTYAVLVADARQVRAEEWVRATKR